MAIGQGQCMYNHFDISFTRIISLLFIIQIICMTFISCIDKTYSENITVNEIAYKSETYTEKVFKRTVTGQDILKSMVWWGSEYHPISTTEYTTENYYKYKVETLLVINEDEFSYRELDIPSHDSSRIEILDCPPILQAVDVSALTTPIDFDTEPLDFIAAMNMSPTIVGKEDLNIHVTKYETTGIKKMGFLMREGNKSINMVNIKLIWTDNEYETVTKERQIPYTIVKQQTITKSQKVPFWEFIKDVTSIDTTRKQEGQNTKKTR